MPAPENSAVVQHNVGASRFEIVVEARLAVAEYERTGNVLVMTHTLVPPELRGRGLAEQLVRAALEHARAEGCRVVPACSYVATFVQRHPEYQALVS